MRQRSAPPALGTQFGKWEFRGTNGYDQYGKPRGVFHCTGCDQTQKSLVISNVVTGKSKQCRKCASRGCRPPLAKATRNVVRAIPQSQRLPLLFAALSPERQQLAIALLRTRRGTVDGPYEFTAMDCWDALTIAQHTQDVAAEMAALRPTFQAQVSRNFASHYEGSIYARA